MRLLKQLSFLTLMLIVAQSAFGQRLLIQYDYLKDDLTYYKVYKSGKKKMISRPVVTRNHNVKIEVINFNPFIYSATAAFESSEIVEQPNLDFISLVSPLGLPAGGSSLLSQIAGGGTSRGLEMAPSRMMSDPDAQKAFAEIEKTYMALYKAEQMLNSIDFILHKTDQLKHNKYLPADSIKQFTQELLNGLFLQESVKTKDFLQMANTLNTSVNGNLASFSSQINAFEHMYNDYTSDSGEAPFAVSGLGKMIKDWETAATTFVGAFEMDDLIDKLDDLEVIYQSIMNTPYVFNVSDVAKGDELVVNLDFYQNPTEGQQASSVEDLQKLKSKEITITVKGDLKITSSVGVAFPYYQDNNEFINKDSMITVIDGNNFTPNIAAYLNFYPYSARNVQFGGTFGVGVPISADSKNFNFMLGGSTIFGSDNRLILNFGATLGQVNKIGEGFEEGNNLGDLITDVPTRKAYDVGAFIGISFSLVNLAE